MIESTITFKLNGKLMEFKVKHNLNKFGLSVEAAFDNWSVRTDEYTVESFCEYVKSKDPNIKCKKA